MDYEGVEQDEYDFYPVLEEERYELSKEAAKQAENVFIKIIIRKNKIKGNVRENEKVLAVGGKSAVITPDGSIYIWGRNSYGEIIGQTATKVLYPKKIEGVKNIVTADIGSGNITVVTGSGEVYTWGYNHEGQLGNGGVHGKIYYTPQRVEEIDNVIDVSCGGGVTAAVTAEGDLYTWGWNRLAGKQTYPFATEVRKVNGIKNVVKAETNGDSIIAMTSTGEVYAWGEGEHGVLGNGNTRSNYIPTKIKGLENVIDVSMGYSHAGAVTADGNLYTWGFNGQGELGVGKDIEECHIPKKVEGLEDVRDVSLRRGWQGSAALTADGTLYVWGSNYCGIIGDGTREIRYRPEKVMENIVEISLASEHSVALGVNGEVYTWGKNSCGQLGCGDMMLDECVLLPMRIEIGGSDKQPFNMNLYRADRLLIEGNIEEEILSDNISRVTPSDIFATELQKNGFDDRVGAWENVSLLFDMADDIGALYDFSIKEQDIYGAIILEALEISTNYGLSDKWNSLLNVKQAEFYTKCKEFARLKYGIDIGVENNFASLTFEQRDELDKLTDAFFTADYVESDGTLKLIDQVSKNIGKIGKEINSLEAYAERMTNSFLLAGLCESTKEVIRAMYNECPDSNYAMKSALKDCKDIIDKSSEKLIVQMISNEIKIAGVDILKQWSKELWKNVKYYLNAGFPALDIVLAGYKGGKWISNLVYNTDEAIEKYHNMLAVLEYEKLLNQVYLDLEDTYRQGRTQDNAETYLSAIDLIFSFKDKDCEKAYGYVNALDESLVNKLGEFFNGASHYDTLKSQINSLQKVYFTSHEDLSTQWIHYLEEDYPGQGLEEQYEHLFEESRKRILQKKYVIACPVDVYIYDENNALVASVVDNEPFCAGDLTVSVEGDEKEFLFYGNEKYRMECIGNDAGTMDITVKEYEADKEKRNISFYDLPLLDGEKYASDVNTVVSENENYAFILNDSQTVFPNYDTEDLERQRYTVKISSGYITDEDSVLLEKQASVGEKLNLKAVIPDGYVFKGWTSDCEQDIFENSQNEKTVMKMPESDVMVTAMLSKDGNNILATDIVLNESEISLTIGEDYQLSAQVFPEQAENKDVYWGSINENVATVGQDGIVTAVSEGSTQIEVKTQDGKRKAICTVNVTPGGFWISEIPPQTYTGTSIKPIVEVYDGETLLTEKVDYTISYKNNIKVNDASEEKTAPTITVAGKGNYTGKETATFQIQAKDISAEDISADDIVLKYNKKVQKPVLVILRDGKRLGYKKDFIVEYPELENNPDAYKEPGEYAIVVKGIGGYSGERTVTQHITAGILMSKVSVGKIANHEYTGQPIEPKVTVKCGKDVLRQDEDYSVSYENNTEIGTAKIILIGMGEYAGTKEVTFKIVGGSLNKAKVTGLITMLPYTGEEQYQNCTLTMTINKMPVVLTENEDYVVTYQKNKNAGTATVLFTGINGYSGTIKKSFRIAPFDIKADGLKEKEDRLFEIEQGIIQPYAKGGTKPKPTVTFNGIILEENVDYKLSYKNNTSVNDGNNPHKLPVISVTGKGNFKGVRSESFVIIPQKIDDVTITASDKVYQARKNAWKPTVALTDVDGKRLSAGRDYEKDFIYTYAEDTLLEDGTKRLAGDAVEASDIPIAGTSLSVTALGKGNYTGTVSGIWRIVKSDIAKAKVVIPAQIYTGKEIKPEKDQIELSIGKEKLKAEDYEIISYSNNVKKGSASVVLQGMGNYGGTKTAKFNIKAKGILWWWKELFN